ncbi:hypothetical protein ACFH04_07510 [Streptomyces noboritoensis]|uniref:Uncharacterized protein n=1 Tax=Streptomyces noboritoensis TaxID=67337 RepID=A0ABV6TCR0_9ACTN
MTDVRHAREHVTPFNKASARRTTTTPHPTHGSGARIGPRPSSSNHRTPPACRAASGRDSPVTGSGAPLP